MKQTKKGWLSGFLAKDRWNSRIKSSNVTGKELWLGYVLGPYGALLIQSVVNSYYNQYMTDVLGFTAERGLWIAGFMVIFPMASKIVDAVTNLIMCNLLDRTTSVQGKLRPWMILSIPLVAISALLLFWVPVSSPTAQVIWVSIAYLLFYAVGYTMWLMPTELSASLSTYNVKQRSNLAMGFTITRNIGTGLVSILFPTMLSAVSRMMNGDNAKGYFYSIAFICCIAVPLIFVQYFYTRERVTEENRKIAVGRDEDESLENGSMWKQFRTAITDKYWVMLMVVLIIGQLFGNLRNISLVYYTGWVVNGNAYGSLASIQAKFQMIAMSPMGIGTLILLPLLKKWGRRRCLWGGAVLMIVGSTLSFLFAGNTTMIYAGSALSAFGSIASAYTVPTYLGDVIDHVEWKSGKRVEGITGGINGIALCVGVGVAQGLFNLGLMLTKYLTPQVVGEIDGVLQYADQPAAATTWINMSYQGGYILLGIMYFVVFLFFFDLENHLDQVRSGLEERKIEECRRRGIEYIPAGELERLEIEKQEKEAEENRIRELKERCLKTGKDFDTENQKVLDKRARKLEKLSKKNEKKGRK